MDFNDNEASARIIRKWEDRKKSERRCFSRFVAEEWERVKDERPRGEFFTDRMRNVVLEECVSYEAAGLAPSFALKTGGAKVRIAPEANCVMTESAMMLDPEDVRTDECERVEESGPRKTVVSPTATFRPTQNTAAAGIVLNNIRKNADLRHSMVRTEELLKLYRL